MKEKKTEEQFEIVRCATNVTNTIAAPKSLDIQKLRVVISRSSLIYHFFGAKKEKKMVRTNFFLSISNADGFECSGI